MNLGLISITIIWLGIIFLIRKWPGDKSKSLSKHAATSRNSTVFYGLLFTISLPLFYLFIRDWFVPSLSLPSFVIWLVLLGSAGQIIAAWVPANGGTNEVIHNYAASVMHGLLLPLSIIVLAFGAISNLTTLIILPIIVTMIAMWVTYLGFNSFAAKNMLYVQMIYVGCFHTVILSATYL